jgi:hypothetical protein
MHKAVYAVGGEKNIAESGKGDRVLLRVTVMVRKIAKKPERFSFWYVLFLLR